MWRLLLAILKKKGELLKHANDTELFNYLSTNRREWNSSGNYSSGAFKNQVAHLKKEKKKQKDIKYSNTKSIN